MDLENTLSTIAATIPQEIEQVVTQVRGWMKNGAARV